MKYLVIVLVILCAFVVLSQRSQTPIVVAEATPTPKPIPTPNPAAGAIKAATEFYPALAQKGSEFNLMFVDLYKYTVKTDPEALVSPEWPLELSKQVGEKLGIQPATIGTPPPKPEPSQTPPPLDDPDNPLSKGAYHKTEDRWPY
jgi:hypothetical protein